MLWICKRCAWVEMTIRTARLDSVFGPRALCSTQDRETHEFRAICRTQALARRGKQISHRMFGQRKKPQRSSQLQCVR